MQRKSVEISKTLCGQESYFSSSSAAKYFVILGGGNDIHRWHSCGGLSEQLIFASFAVWRQTQNLHWAQPCNGFGLTTGSRGCAEAGTVVPEWHLGMWLTVYESLKHFFQFYTVLFLS